MSACLGILCFAAFLYLIDYAARLLRPISILALVGKAGLAVIESVYPDPSLGRNQTKVRRPKLGAPNKIIQHLGASEIILAVNLNELIVEAKKSNGVIELVPQVGDFIATDEPLFKLYGGAASLDEWKLRSTVAFGPERTMEQDPTFAYRIIVDIALKALSPAINDPTTAVIAIDQLHRLLRKAGNRNLRADEILDESGQLRVIFRTPNWEDFVHLAFTEIRSLRCAKYANCSTTAGNDRESYSDIAKAPSRCLAAGTVAARSRHRKVLCLPRRPRPCPSSGIPRDWEGPRAWRSYNNASADYRRYLSTRRQPLIRKTQNGKATNIHEKYALPNRRSNARAKPRNATQRGAISV